MAQDRGKDAHCWAPLRTDPDRPDSSIRFLPGVFDGEALIGPWMTGYAVREASRWPVSSFDTK
jgi:hypothetical protein